MSAPSPSSMKAKHLIFAIGGQAYAEPARPAWFGGVENDEARRWGEIGQLDEDDDDQPNIIVIELSEQADSDVVANELQCMGFSRAKATLMANSVIADGTGFLRVELSAARMSDLREAADHFAAILGQGARYEGPDMPYDALEAMLEGWAISHGAKAATAPSPKTLRV